MKENKKVSPSLGVCGRKSAATKSKFKRRLAFLSVLFCVLMLSSNAWAGGIVYNGGTYMTATSKNTAQGLVYASTSKNANPGLNQYSSPSSSDEQTGGGENVTKNFYIWAKPARGFYFSVWDGYSGQTTKDSWTNTGKGDKIEAVTPRNQHIESNIVANFQPLTPYDVVYKQPNGGSYTVRYLYLSVDESTVKFNTNDGETLQLTPTSGDLRPTDSKDATNHKTYATDSIILSTENTNFIGWYKNGEFMSDANPYTKYKADADATISAMFKEIGWGEVTGDVTTNVTAIGTYDSRTVYVAIPTLIGDWKSSNFTVAPTNSSNDFGSIHIDGVVLNKEVTPKRLEITYTYTATNWGGVEATFTITPTPGATKQFSVACSAEEVVNYEACIEENDVRVKTGDLTEMISIANGDTYENPVVKLMQDKTITAPLSFTKSMTFDVNGKVLTANCASAFSIDAAGIDVKIIDGSFTQVGEIHTSNASSGVVSVVTFTQAAKLTMQGGTLSAENTGTGSAYGVNVSNGSIFYMTNGQLTVAGVSEARGVNVASANDYATFNGGSLTVSAPANAYGLWSAGSSNITSATISVEATTGANAYGVYVDGGVSTLGSNTIMATAKTTNAYSAFVNAGRLNGNGGSFAATAVTSGAYGVHIASGATAMLQQKATVTAEATGVSGTNVFGINNLGTVSLTNISVTATSPTTAATALNTETSTVSTTIEGGTYRANTTGGTAYGLHHQYGTLNVDGGEFKAVGGGNEIYGVLAVEDATIANATLYGETQGTGNTVYGFKGDGTGKNFSLTGCAIEAVSNTNKAYAIYSNANVTVTSCTLTATTLGTSEAYGFYAKNGTNKLTNCNATVISKTVQAYGVNHVAGSLTIEGGQYDVDTKQAAATAAQSSQAYGIYNAASQTTTVDGATFNVIASNNSWSQSVFAAYINGVLNSTNATYSATGRTYVYCVYGLGSSTLNLTGNTITSTTTNGQYSYGIYAKKNFSIDGDIVSAIGTTTDVYAMFFDANNSIGEVQDGKFTAQGNGTNGYGALNAAGSVGKVKLKGGVYKTTINLQKYAYTGYQLYHLDGTDPDYPAGYRYTIAAENPSPYVCHIVNGAYYTTLEAAMQYTLDNTGNYTIVMTQPYTLPAGDYTLPSNATLIVPCRSGQTSIVQDNPNNPAMPDRRTTVGLRENFICLTMAANAHINVNGKIGISGDMYCKESGYTGYNNTPFGRIHMEAGSLIQLNSGAHLYAWGFITGSGDIKVKNNAEVHEMFQVGDMQTVGNLADGYYGNSHGHFLINQYSIPNIEVPTTYYYNSRLIGAMFSYYAGSNSYQGGNEIKLVGTSDALFEVTTNDESAWVRKSYDAVNDLQVWDVNSAAQLGSIELTVASQTINSLDYILPITSNMKIHILDGEFKITQSTEFLPGASLEIDKTASLTINEKYENSSHKEKALKVYVFDKDQWTLTTSSCSPIYSPSWPNGSKPSRTVGDAAINIHGNIDVKGSLYTTRSISGGTNTTYGANIYSNNTDAGTIYLENTAPSSQTSINIITGVSNHSLVTKEVTMDPALLKNGTGASQAFTPTSGTATNHSFAYMDNEWKETYTNGCFEVIGENVYVKPSGYVQLKKSQIVDGLREGVEEADHTYLTIDDDLLILMNDCQWWEVEKEEGSTNPEVFECKKTGYEGFYYYDDSDSDPQEWAWKLKTVNVKFYSAEEGDNVLKTIVTDYKGIPDQSVIATNPSKGTTAEYTYQFYGWKSSVTGDTLKWTDPLEVATANMSYRPVFTETKRNYTVTLVDAYNGANVPLEVPYGETPEYTPVKNATEQYTYTFDHWEPALAPVTGSGASYTAQWNNIVNRYTITWMDGETVLETDKHQLYGSATAFNGTLPTKATDDNFVYAFSGWRSSLTGQTYANGSTPTVAGETTYEAQFSTTPRYAITFNNYDGTELQKESVMAGEHPIYNGLTPGRVRDLDGYFRFIGWKNSEGEPFEPNDVLPAVTGKETYTAQYAYVTELYEITLNNIDGAGGTWKGKFGVGSIPFYDPNNDDVADMPTKAGNAQYSCPFTGWTPALEPVSGKATYTAQFGQEINSYDITFANLDGNEASQTIKVEYGQTPVCPVTPTKDDGINSYPFTGWKNSNDDDYAPDATLPAVAGEETYTATFSSTPIERKFDITFDLDNGSQVIVPVTYGTTPEWTGETPTKPATAQYTYTFAGWYPEFALVTGEETYIAQYTQTLNSYTVTFMDRGETLLSSSSQYGTTPTKPGEPKAWVDDEHSIAYSFAGWSDGVNVYAHNAIPTVSGDVTYTAQYTEFANLVATVTTSAGVTTPYNSWGNSSSGALGAALGAANSTLKLYANVTASNNNQISRNLTIDLNGHTITCVQSSRSNTRLFYINGGNLAIKDSKGGGLISYTGQSYTTYYAVYVNSANTLTINGGTIQVNADYYYNNTYKATGIAVYLNNANSILNQYGGKIEAVRTDSRLDAYAISSYSTSRGYANIYGGKLKAETAIFQTLSTARVTLSGGYYSLDPGNSVTIASGYEKRDVGNEEPEHADYVKKVVQVYTITFKNWNNNNLETPKTWEVGTTPAYSGATPTKPQDNQYTYAHSGWTPAIVPVEANATYTATFTGTYRDYTITWKDLDGTSLGTTQVPYDNATRPTHDAPTHADPYCSFIGWKAASNGVTYAADELPYVGVNALAETYTAQYECNYPEIVIDEHETETIAINTETSTTTIHTDGTLNVADGVTLTTTNLILEASENASGQIIENGSIAATNVYYDLYLNTDARHWHAFGVPWIVDINTNPLAEVDNDGNVVRTLNISRDYEIMYYDGSVRATEGPSANCWKYLRHYEDTEHGQPVELLNPGQGYMIAFGSHVNTVRFVKKATAPIIFDGSVTVQAEGSGADRGINAIANPMAYHATLNAGPKVGYVHDGGEIGSDGYDKYDIDAKSFIVGKTVYVQVESTGNVLIAKSNAEPISPILNAPKKNTGKATDKKYLSLSDYYHVSIASETTKGGSVYVLPEEDKEDKYVIGHDLEEFGMSTKKAQIWVKRYDVNLGLNTTAPINEVASFPIYLYAPTAGEYTISLASQPDDEYTVYLTLNGEAIWNLSETPYALSLNAGTQKNYGLRLTANPHSPAVTTGIDEAVVDAQGETRKVIIEDKVYIIRGNNVYSVDGQLVR